MHKVEARVTATAESDLSRRRLKLCASAEWQSVCAKRHNVLLEGPEVSTNAVLLLLKPRLSDILDWWRPGAPLELPTSKAGALILEDVGGLLEEDQARLLTWLSATDLRRQIVATTTHSLFAVVARGCFNKDLYYRLNLVLLQVNFSDRREPWRNARGTSSDRRPTVVSTPDFF